MIGKPKQKTAVIELSPEMHGVFEECLLTCRIKVGSDIVAEQPHAHAIIFENVARKLLSVPAKDLFAHVFASERRAEDRVGSVSTDLFELINVPTITARAIASTIGDKVHDVRIFVKQFGAHVALPCGDISPLRGRI